MGSNGGVREIAVNDGADWRDLQIVGIISNGGITKTGDGVLRLQGVNAYSDLRPSAPGVELNLLGQIDVNSAITNNAEFRIDGGTHTVGTIAGIGTTRLINGWCIYGCLIGPRDLDHRRERSMLTIQPWAAVRSQASLGNHLTVPEPTALPC